jgi:glucose/mannose-6-phosphate isomerase
MPQPTVLDQPSEIKKVDQGNMIGVCERLPELSIDALKRGEEVEIPRIQFSNLVVAGMGGSAIGGELLKDWLSDRAAIPIAVCRDYTLPAYVDEKSLVVAVSYSGETEETLSALLQAARRRCVVATVSSGGRMKAFSQRLRLPHIPIPEGFHPRAAIAYLFFPLMGIVDKAGIYENKGEVDEALRILERVSKENALASPLEDNKAKQLAVETCDTIPVVYGSRQYSAVARRLKCQFNENSKVPSKYDVFPEVDHNEVVGWEAPDHLTKAFSAIFIRDPLERQEIRKRIEVTKQIVSPKASKTVEIQAEGRQKLARMLSAMYVGDFASLYLAVLRGVDPAPTKTIAYLKQEMKRELDLISRLENEVGKM